MPWKKNEEEILFIYVDLFQDYINGTKEIADIMYIVETVPCKQTYV